MEEIREVALAYYDNCTAELQGKTWEFFQSMDTDSDNRISPSEFNEFLRQTGYNAIIIDPNFFSKLDRNGDRRLDFKEFLTFYYIIKTGYTWCRGCSVFLSGLYYTCFECFEDVKNPSTFDLCDGCHRSRKFPHHHHTVFLENHILLYYKRGPVIINMAMEDLYNEGNQAITFYYDHASHEQKNSAMNFFMACYMPTTHGQTQINYAAFNEFLDRKGYNWIIDDPHLFGKLDRNRDGVLDFWEIHTFYYIISKRYLTYFHCRECQVYLGGLYFTCVACFEEGAHHNRHNRHYNCDPGTYNLCASCYRSRRTRSNISHNPNHTYFLDNHILLLSKRGHPPYPAPHLVSAPKPLVVYHNTYNITYNLHHPAPPKKNWISSLQILEMALAGANLASLCSIM